MILLDCQVLIGKMEYNWAVSYKVKFSFLKICVIVKIIKNCVILDCQEMFLTDNQCFGVYLF